MSRDPRPFSSALPPPTQSQTHIRELLNQTPYTNSDRDVQRGAHHGGAGAGKSKTAATKKGDEPDEPSSLGPVFDEVWGVLAGEIQRADPTEALAKQTADRFLESILPIAEAKRVRPSTRPPLFSIRPPLSQLVPSPNFFVTLLSISPPQQDSVTCVMMGKEAIMSTGCDLMEEIATLLHDSGKCRVAFMKVSDAHRKASVYLDLSLYSTPPFLTPLTRPLCTSNFTSNFANCTQDPDLFAHCQAHLLNKWTARPQKKGGSAAKSNLENTESDTELDPLPWVAVIPNAQALPAALLTRIAVWWDKRLREDLNQSITLVVGMGNNGPWLLKE